MYRDRNTYEDLIGLGKRVKSGIFRFLVLPDVYHYIWFLDETRHIYFSDTRFEEAQALYTRSVWASQILIKALPGQEKVSLQSLLTHMNPRVRTKAKEVLDGAA